jgi:pyrroloquinoline-quinone synthase
MSDFTTELIAARDARHSKDHPFFDLWAAGRLTLPQTGVYMAQHYHYVTGFLDWVMYVASQAPERAVKRYLLENLSEEEDPNDTHLDMQFDYAGLCGFSRDAVVKSRPLPLTEALIHWGWHVAQREPWPIALAAFLVGLESQVPGIMRRLVPAFETHYGYPPTAREIRFFTIHIAADERHGSRGLELVDRACDTPALRARAVDAVRTATHKRWEHMNGIYWFALHNRDDLTPPFP